MLGSPGDVTRCYLFIVYPGLEWHHQDGRVSGHSCESAFSTVHSMKMLSWLGWIVLRCPTVLNSHIKWFGTCPQGLPPLVSAVLLPQTPPRTFPFSCLSPGQVVVEVIQLVGLLFQGSLCPGEGSDPRSLPQGIPLLCQSKELGKGLMITIPQHVHTDVLLVRVPVTGNKNQNTELIMLILQIFSFFWSYNN